MIDVYYNRDDRRILDELLLANADATARDKTGKTARNHALRYDRASEAPALKETVKPWVAAFGIVQQTH